MKTRQTLISFSTLLVFSISIVNQAFTQTASSNKIKTVNLHIKFADKLTHDLNNSQKCLKSLYSRLEPGRKPKGFFHISDQYICGKSVDDSQFKNLLSQTKNVKSNDALEINSHTQKLYDIYLNINKLCRELEIYIRLEDYKKDYLKKSDEIYLSLKKSYEEYAAERKIFHQFVVELTEPEMNIIKQKNLSAYRNMRTYLLNEQRLLTNFQLNFCIKTFTSSLPVDLMLEQIKESDNYLNSIDVPNGNEFKKYEVFVSAAIKLLQNTKRKAIDSYSVDARKSDTYTNSFIDNYLHYFNGFLIKDFNDFVDDNEAKMLYYPRMIVPFKLDSIEKEYTIPLIKYKASEIPNLIINTHNVEIEPKTVAALNNYIEFINEEQRINYDFAIKLYYLNNSANRQIESNPENLYLSFNFYDKYALPIAAYEKTINESNVIDKHPREILNNLLEELYQIIGEKYQLIEDLDTYISKKNYRSDSQAHLYDLLERFDYLLEMFDQRKQLLYSYARKVYESYPFNAQSPWQIGGKGMLQLLDTNYIAFVQIKNECLNQKYEKVDTEVINVFSRNLLINEYENLKGLKKIGHSHGNCPYNPYENIATRSADYAEYIAKFPNQERIKRDMPNYFREFAYKFNDLVDDYNKFVDLAMGGYDTFNSHNIKELYLLKSVKQAVFYKFTKPEIIKTGQIEKKEKDSSLISMEGFANNNLVLLLDVSGSMKAEDKLPLLRASFLSILPYLRAVDEISIVVFSGKGKVLLSPISCSKKEKITEALESLESKGQSNFSNGLKLAYKTAKSNFKPNANNRIILATDGAFFIDDELYQLVENESDKNTFLSVFSFGNRDNKVRALDKLANMGKGNYEYIEVENAVEKLLKELQALRLD